MVNTLTAVVVFTSIVLVVLAENHFLAAGGVLRHVNMWVSEVLVVASGGVVPLRVVQGTIFVFDMPGGGGGERGEGRLAFVRAVNVVLLQLAS